MQLFTKLKRTRDVNTPNVLSAWLLAVWYQYERVREQRTSLDIVWYPKI